MKPAKTSTLYNGAHMEVAHIWGKRSASRLMANVRIRGLVMLALGCDTQFNSGVEFSLPLLCVLRVFYWALVFLRTSLM